MNEEISSNYFYNSWINSFEIEEYKKDKTYQHFIKKNKISSLEQMGKYVKKLLKGKTVNLYMDDPYSLSKEITYNIKQY